MEPQVRKYMPDYVELYCVDYRDNLSQHQELLSECVNRNSLMPLSEQVFDWWDFPEQYYLDEIRQRMQEDCIDDLFDSNYEDILDYLSANDRSNPVEQLLKNTGAQSCFYDLGLELDCGYHYAFMCTPWRNESPAAASYKIRRKLGIKKDSPEAEQILRLCKNASCGGSLRLYFKSDIVSLISGDKYEESTENDFQQIRFQGKVAVAIYNPNEGSGDFEYIAGNFTLPFIRDNISLSSADKYSLEECFGMCSDWLDRCATPILSVEPLKRKHSIKKSKIQEWRENEKMLDATFKAGGCTHGDMDITRHRGVYYDNSFPCGSRCPHCNTFWID